MKTYKLKNGIILLLLLLFLVAFSKNQAYLRDNDEFLNQNLNLSNTWNLSPLIIDDTGAGNYTWGEAVLQPWCSGSGTQNNPYIIENIFIDAAIPNSPCLTIQYSVKHFIVRNSTFIDSWSGGSSSPYIAGLRIINASNGLIQNNTFENNNCAISLHQTSYIKIINNSFNSNVWSIAIVKSQFVEIIENILDRNGVGGVGIYNWISDYNKISYNVIKGGNAAVFFDTGCYNNLVTNNWLYNFADSAISLWGISTYNEIIDNSISLCLKGIELKSYSYYNTIAYNNITSCSESGIQMGGPNIPACTHNTIIGNNISDNLGNGIKMILTAIFNIIKSNIISNNGIAGIDISGANCINNSIYNNSFKSNIIHAIDNDGQGNWWNNPDLCNWWNNSEIGNFWDNYTGSDFNDDGIGDIPHNISLSPLVQDMQPIWDDGDDPTPPELTIITPNDRQVIGYNSPTFEVYSKSIYIDSMWYNLNYTSTNRTISEFTGIINQIMWNQFTEGNITITFYANDTLGYVGSAEILVEKDLTLPIIAIDSPIEGDAFGTEAPIFNITIIEKNYLICWYTLEGEITYIQQNFSLNGGITNLTITDNNIYNFIGIINQTAWDSLPSGNITVTFYAQDTAGNTEMISVTIIKSIPSQPLIPGYNILFFIGAISIGSIIIIIRKMKTQN